MKTNAIQPRDFNGIQISQRTDGYFNATAMCRANGKLWNDYWRLDDTSAYLEALSVDTGIPVSTLVVIRKGGNRATQGTWVHPDIAIHLAQWCNPRFAVQVSKWVRELLTTGTVSLSPRQARYELEGRTAVWVEERIDGVEERKGFTGTLKSHGVKAGGYSACTNAIYTPVLGGPAAAVKAQRRLPKKASLRDSLSRIELAKVKLSEMLAAERIAADDFSGNDECAAVCSLAAQSIAAAHAIALNAPTRPGQ